MAYALVERGHALAWKLQQPSAYVSIRQHASAYVSTLAWQLQQPHRSRGEADSKKKMLAGKVGGKKEVR